MNNNTSMEYVKRNISYINDLTNQNKVNISVKN